MTTTINSLTDLQNMKNDLTEDYVLGGDIDASGSAVLNATNNIIWWSQSMPYVLNDVVHHDGTRKICRRYANHAGGLISFYSKQSWGLKPYPTDWELRTVRFPMGITKGVSPSGRARLSLYYCDADYVPTVETTYLYTFSDITDHIHYYNFHSDAQHDYYDVWLTLPEGYEFLVTANSKWAVVFQPDVTTDYHLVTAYDDFGANVPTNLPSSSTTYYGTFYVYSSGAWQATDANVTIYPAWYYVCNTAHTSQTYLSDDASSWDNYQDLEPPSYLGFEPVGDSSTKFTGTFDGAGYR